ncbi:MAG: YraN family protein [Polyangiales bacterium]
MASSAKRSSKQAEMGSAEATASATRRSTSSPSQRSDLSRRGESLVAALLIERGFEILGRNVRVGRLELDVIARQRSLIVVCEVRSRRSAHPVFPAETIVGKKLNRVRRATALWLRRERLGKVRVRIDAAAVVFDGPNGEPRVEYYENVSFPLRSG